MWLKKVASLFVALMPKRGKISMLRSGCLTVSQVVKHAIRGKGDLAEQACAHIVARPDLHVAAVALVAPYVASKRKVCVPKHAFRWHAGTPYVECVQEGRLFPERLQARLLLSRISGVNPGIEQKIDAAIQRVYDSIHGTGGVRQVEIEDIDLPIAVIYREDGSMNLIHSPESWQSWLSSPADEVPKLIV